MNVWTIRFLGVPCARNGDREAHLRSKETWAVLASLLLPITLRGEALSRFSRETLADRFWADSPVVEPRTHLRQCLASLNAAFGSDCLIADRQDVRIASGWFTTDLDLIFAAHRKAVAADSNEERLHWLIEAEQEICGEFFEGWTPESDEAQLWLIQTRADLRSRLVPLLLLLAQTLQVTGNPTAAFDIARRALIYHPGNSQVRKLTWELADSTGQQDVIHALEQVQSFRDAIELFPAQESSSLTLRDVRTLQALFDTEMAMLPAAQQKAVLRCSVFPAPFPPKMAQEVCGASVPVLRALANTPFLKQTEAAFFLPPMVRDCARKRLSPATRRGLKRRLARFCMETVGAFGLPVGALPLPLAPVDLARPYLLETLEWILNQPPTEANMWFINMLRHRGLNELALMGIPYFRKIESNSSLPVEMRINVGLMAAYILMQNDEDAAAIPPLEIALSLTDANPDHKWYAAIYPTLMRAYSNIGDWEAARRRGLQALESCREMVQRGGEVHCLRFLAEIALYAEEPELALQLCEQAQLLGEGLPPGSDYLPDALYMKARILNRLQRVEEALDAIETALSLWQEAGDTKIGLCLFVLGQIHLGLGRYAEARMHLEHALHRHSRSGREGHRLAAVESLGDVFCAMQRHSEARVLYEECLAYYSAKGHVPGTSRLEGKLYP